MSTAMNLESLELRRLQLEENITKLRKTLQHWRTWDAEYDGLKEEIAHSNDAQTASECRHISDALAGELVNEKEILELYGATKGSLRPNNEVVRLIDRRQDYVQQNISTITKQLRSLEESLQRLDGEAEDESMTYSAGLPMTEILEELDEDGNVISSKVSQPELATAQIIDTLRKAGLADVDSSGVKSVEIKTQQPQDTAPQPQSLVSSASVIKTESSVAAATDRRANSDGVKKTVKFADHVQEHVLPTSDQGGSTSDRKAPPDNSLLRGSFDGGDRVIEVDDDDDIVGATPIIPDNESPEDARLRREMLQYSLNEIGSVVAELDLEDVYSDDEDDYDFDEDDDDIYASDVSEEEDEFGRSIRKGVSKSYRQQMLELEEKLSARMIENLGPSPDEENPEIDPNDLRKLVVRKEEDDASTNTESKQTPPKRGVRFADTLDISDAPQKPQQPAPTEVEPTSVPMSDLVVERSAPKQSEAIETKQPAKPSRFKQNRRAKESAEASNPITHMEPRIQMDPEPIAPKSNGEGPILANKIIERPPKPGNAPPPADDEFDPEMQQRQLASEYFRIRNNMIQQQGGFRATDEELDQPLMEERDGKVKKVSRFKAARLNL
ncbi:hypothetical protein MBLNU459_g8542t1 [Dothideomycetes sp. NU459]